MLYGSEAFSVCHFRRHCGSWIAIDVVPNSRPQIWQMMPGTRRVQQDVPGAYNHDNSRAKAFIITRQVTRATHVRNRVGPRVELILKIIIIFLGFIKSKPC